MPLQEQNRDVPTLPPSGSSKDLGKLTLIHSFQAIRAIVLPINTLISRRSASGNLGKHICFPQIISIMCVRTQLLDINKPLNLYCCLCHRPSTMPEVQIRRSGNRESQKLTVPAGKQTWNHTFCFNPGQPHHLISMYKRTSEYKRASKYKWHERLKYFICHPRKVTWQLSCRD